MELASLLATLGREPDELVALLNRKQEEDAPVRYRGHYSVADAPSKAKKLRGDVYFTPLPRDPDVEYHGQGGKDTVTKIDLLYVDLDSKEETGMGSEEGCRALLAALTTVLGVEPVAVVATGTGGLHPYWRLSEPIKEAQLKAWAQLVRAEAIKLGGHADYFVSGNPATILRAPGHVRQNGQRVELEVNDDPQLVDVVEFTNLIAPYLVLTDKYSAGEVAFETWQPGKQTCEYVESMIDGWADDDNEHTTKRHTWLYTQLHRLMAAARLGCITQEDFNRGEHVIVQRFRQLLATQHPKRLEARYEISDAIGSAKSETTKKTEAYLRERELGGHDCVNEDPDEKFERKLEEERLRRRVKRALDREEADAIAELSPRFQIMTLEQRRELDDPIPRIDKIMPYEANTLFVAQNKTGKTIIALNLVRSLLTGEQFLDQLDVRPLAQDESVAYFNYEVSGALLEKWARCLGIDDDPRFVPIHLRDCRNPLRFPSDRERLANELKRLNVKVVIVDTFSRAFNGSGDENSNKDVVPWLLDLNAFARVEAGATDLALLAHAGHNPDHARGASALEDWPDNKVYLRKEKGDKRSIRTEGRMDEQLETSLTEYDEETHRVTLGYSVASAAKVDKDQVHKERLSASLSELEAEWRQEHANGEVFPGVGKSAIKGVKAQDRDVPLNELVESGFVEQLPGRQKGVHLYRNIKPYGLANRLDSGLTLVQGGA